MERNVISMCRGVKEWTVEEIKCEARLYLSMATVKAMAEVVA